MSGLSVGQIIRMIEFGREVLENIEEDERYREMVKHQACIGVFIIFTCKRLLWVIKDKSESWTGQYFHDIILTQNVFPVVNNEENVIDPNEVIFVHDKAPCMRANRTQHLLQDNNVKFWVMISRQEIHLISAT
jgi:hypothetical protein